MGVCVGVDVKSRVRKDSRVDAFDKILSKASIFFIERFDGNQ